MSLSLVNASGLAASGSPSLFLILVGVVPVLVLLGAFWWGSRRVARRRRSAGVAQPPPAEARRDSWSAPEEGQTR
ncbi:DUF6479 family protein [Streptomyces roseolus]|uniref:DUF6479 family protein n=1 Tax=Streptomyces roseolus TaxID=67358 RepID=UPI00167C271F|nr:DUF6479 family protein [Streptomyces roseolus]GGR18391.1 hypothetical protein GCM10010282_08200 [Streptomyces roseolus]